MKADDNIMIEMIREFFSRKCGKWDYPMSVKSYKIEGNKIFIWYYITHPIISFKKEKLISFRFPWSKVEEEEVAKPTLGLISIDKEEYEFKVAYREAYERDKKINNILYGGV
jgi:hypothetical protein